MNMSAARSWLFVPGTRADRFDRATAAGADAVVVDLEDAVPPAQKPGARDVVAAWLTGTGRAWVRINAAGTPWHDEDIAAMVGCPGLLGIMLPKAEVPATVTAVAERLGRDDAVVPLVETAAGIVDAVALARARGVARLAFGSVDFALDIGCSADEDRALQTARGILVLASRAAGLPGPVDGATVDLLDAGAVRADAERARRLGFTGKLVIHPRQLGPVHDGFAPTAAEVAWARRIVSVVRTDGGAVAVDGSLVDVPVLARARAIVDRITG